MEGNAFQDHHLRGSLQYVSFQEKITEKIDASKPQTEAALDMGVQNDNTGPTSALLSSYLSHEDGIDAPVNIFFQPDTEEQQYVAPRSIHTRSRDNGKVRNSQDTYGPGSKFSNLANGWILYNQQRFVPHPNKFGKLCQPEAHSRICSCIHRNCRKIRLEGACQGVVKYKMSIRESAFVWGVKKSTLQENLANVRYRTQIEYLTNLVEEDTDGQ